MRSGSLARQTQSVPGKPIGQEWDARTYTGVGPHPADPRAAQVAAQVMALINQIRPGTSADHVGSTAVPGLIGKNVVDLQITASPAEVPAITGARHHCHVVPTTDTDVRQMIEFRDLLRADPGAREAYAADKLRITAAISDSLEYTQAKTHLIQRLLGN